MIKRNRNTRDNLARTAGNGALMHEVCTPHSEGEADTGIRVKDEETDTRIIARQ